MPRKSLGFVRLEWVCPNCRTRNPGPEKSCIRCGAPQPENVQFERPADEQLVKDEVSIQAARAGADFVCPYCGTRNSASAKVCAECGGDLLEARRRASGAVLEKNEGQLEVVCPNCGTKNPQGSSNCLKCGAPLGREAGPVQPSPAAASRPSATGGRSKWLLWGALGAAVAICAAAVILFVLPSSTVGATVADVHWVSSVPVQQIQPIHYTNKSGSPPSDAYDLSCQTVSRDVCEDRIVDQGNGFGEVVQDCRTESEDYCSYTVDRWETIQTLTLEAHDLFPVYAQPEITADQRLGTQQVEYTVVFDTAKGGKTYSPADQSEFEKYALGSSWDLSLNALGGVVKVR